MEGNYISLYHHIVLLFDSYSFLPFVVFFGICNVAERYCHFLNGECAIMLTYVTGGAAKATFFHKSQTEQLLSGSDPKHPSKMGIVTYDLCLIINLGKNVGNYFVILLSPFNATTSASKMRHFVHSFRFTRKRKMGNNSTGQGGTRQR